MPFEPTGVTRTTAPEPPPVFRSESVGDLFFENERSTDEPADRLFDHRDFPRGCRAILRNITVSSMYAFREGLRRDLGVTSSSQIVLWDDEFDARSLLLTANSEAVYGLTFLAVENDGTTVVEVAPGMLGVVNDVWLREASNVGPAGPDRGRGGRFLFIPTGYDGEFRSFDDADGRSLDVGRTYEIGLPPIANVWPVVISNVWTRSLRANGQAVADHQSLRRPRHRRRWLRLPHVRVRAARLGCGNRIRTRSGTGWLRILRLCGSTDGCFDRSW